MIWVLKLIETYVQQQQMPDFEPESSLIATLFF